MTHQTVDEPEVISRELTLQGAAADLFAARDLEVLATSGAGTGKSFSLMVKANYTAREHPGCRQLFMRQTRKSLSETILPDWEEEVLWDGHPAIHGTAKRGNRDDYIFPNGSLIGLGSADHIDRVLSSKWDRVYFFQAEETTLEVWEKLTTRLRAFRTPYHQIIADVNPTVPTHWLLGRVKGGHMARIDYRHEDNPAWYDVSTGEWTEQGASYLETLRSSLTGVRRDRLLRHLWVSAEGIVWETYDSARHLVSGECVFDEGRGRWLLHVPQVDEEPIEVKWFGASMDFGFRAPGCMQVWAFDEEGRAFRVAEVYHTSQNIDWWADWGARLWERYGFLIGVCDWDPGSMEKLNGRVGEAGGREAPGLWREWSKKRGKTKERAGIDEVRVGFDQDRIYLLRDALQHPADPSLASVRKPVCTEDEVPGYIYPVEVDGQPVKEEPHPACADHGCDAMRGMIDWAWNRTLAVEPPKVEYKSGTYGATLFDGKWDEIIAGRHRPKSLRLGTRRRGRVRRVR